MLHSGSRGIGNALATWHMAEARHLGHNSAICDPDLATFLAQTPEMDAYVADLNWAQQYALLNRQVMVELILSGLRRKIFPTIEVLEKVQCHHNYLAEEVHFGEKVFITRKGAVRAEKGDLVLIPGSMSTGSYVCRGLGNADSFNSSPHGAGRRMSRTAAEKAFTQQDLKKRMEGITWDGGAYVDEIADCYKPLKTVMEDSSDLVEVVHTLRQFLNIKASDKPRWSKKKKVHVGT